MNFGALERSFKYTVRPIANKIFKTSGNIEKVATHAAETITSKECRAADAYGRAGIKLSKSSRLSKITQKTQQEEIPEYIYHITSKDNYIKIMKSGKINVSNWEASSDNGLAGVYMVDKHNFLNAWNQTTDLTKITGMGEADSNLGKLLLSWIIMGSKSHELHAIKIPTSSLDKSKLRFRPYSDVVNSLVAANPDMEMIKKGLTLEKLSEYQRKSVPIEYVYTDSIPSDMIQSVNTRFADPPCNSENTEENNAFLDLIIKKLFTDN